MTSQLTRTCQLSKKLKKKLHLSLTTASIPSIISSWSKNEDANPTQPGNYSRLACEFQFVRSMGYYLIQIYIPASLIVVISWVSFW